MTDTEKQLYEYSDTKKRIAELERQLDELKAKQESQYDRLLGAKPPKEIKTSGGSLYDPVVDAVAQLVDVYARRINDVAFKFMLARNKLNIIEDIIDKAELTEMELRYVQLRYFDRLPAWKVAQALHLCEKQAYNYRRSALEKIEGLFTYQK